MSKTVAGDICVLNSGGPMMTVMRVMNDGDRLDVAWMDDREQLQNAIVPDVCVTMRGKTQSPSETVGDSTAFHTTRQPVGDVGHGG